MYQFQWMEYQFQQRIWFTSLHISASAGFYLLEFDVTVTAALLDYCVQSILTVRNTHAQLLTLHPTCRSLACSAALRPCLHESRERLRHLPCSSSVAAMRSEAHAVLIQCRRDLF